MAIGLVALGLLATLGLANWISSAQAATLNLETLTAGEAEKLLQEGQVTSVELVKAYEARIEALNKSGPGLNIVTQLNPNVLLEAKAADKERKKGKSLGPDAGVPILLKDIIDATPMYTSAGDWALRETFPEKDSGVTKVLRQHGVIILGKVGLSEWANSFGSQPSGFSNLTGQVLNANDTAAGPSGSSSGSGAAAAAGFSTLTIGTETSGSIISPSTAENVVGLRPTLGLVPGYGIAPIDASQDTAGPIVKTVEDAATTLESVAEVTGSDAEANAEYEPMMGPNFLKNEDIQPAPFTTLPEYKSALSMEFVKGKRIGFNGTSEPILKAVAALEAAGAIMVPDASTTVGTVPSLPSKYEEHATIDGYYQHLGAAAPVKSLVQEVQVDETNPQEALKFGNSQHKSESEAEDTQGGKNQKEYEEKLPVRKTAFHTAIEKMMKEPSGGGGPVIAVVGSVPSGPQAGDPEITVPMGYTATQRRSQNVNINGGAYDELNLIGVAYVVEQSTKLHKGPAEVDPSAYRCAHTVPAEPFASRGHCNPDYESISKGGFRTTLPVSLETTSATTLEKMLTEGTLTSKELVKAELYRIALTNANGPALQAVRDLNANAINEAAAFDQAKKKGKAVTGPLAGIPVLVNDSIDDLGLPTSGGSIALQDDLPSADSTIVSKLKAAGAIVLGDTNTSELGGEFDPNMPQGYSSLGGQVLLSSDTNKNVGGSSAGSAVAVSVGMASVAIGSETSTDSAQMIAVAGNAGVVALKPTVGLISRTGVMPVAKSQDSPGPIGQTVSDVAAAMGVLAGPDPSDPATTGQPSPVPSYTAGLSPTALSGKKVAVVTSTTAPYPTAVSELGTLGAATTVVTPGAATKAASVIPYEFHRDLNTYLSAAATGPKSLQEIIEYNTANPVEGLKFQQNSLLASQAVNTADPATTTTYEENLTKGKAESQAVINAIIQNGTPEDTSDDYAGIMVPSGNALVNIADRAGYPVLSVPAGFGAENSSTGGDPIGVDFIGAAYSEAQLLDDGFALEEGLKARQLGPEYMKSAGNPTFSGAPSQLDQSMWRCVPGSSFYKPYACNFGELAG
ncbi:MAG TPA: amidase family protein [Solirubrobacteraceae bacterium]|jgi:Asp-tRNA(Asn)/Glu-tRNA(Gln) amidotransferase A subunit family amidase|nr:amidase family protein [Solirubrobacteraceae bacterium]